MSKRRVFALLMGLICCLLLVGVVLAQTSASYDLTWNVIAGGGGPISSTSYAINSTIGQAAVGRVGNSTFELCSGFWCGAAVVEYEIYLPIVLKNYP
jgi:uncharacterized membrane protein YccF (DUF307 family)